jgi:hypothetical protein
VARLEAILLRLESETIGSRLPFIPNWSLCLCLHSVVLEITSIEPSKYASSCCPNLSLIQCMISPFFVHNTVVFVYTEFFPPSRCRSRLDTETRHVTTLLIRKDHSLLL